MLTTLKTWCFRALNRLTARPENESFARLTQAMGEPVRDLDEAARKIEAFIRETRTFETQCQEIVGKLRDELLLHETFASGIREWAYSSLSSSRMVPDVVTQLLIELDSALPIGAPSSIIQRANIFSSAPPQH